MRRSVPFIVIAIVIVMLMSACQVRQKAGLLDAVGSSEPISSEKAEREGGPVITANLPDAYDFENFEPTFSASLMGSDFSVEENRNLSVEIGMKSGEITLWIVDRDTEEELYNSGALSGDDCLSFDLQLEPGNYSLQFQAKDFWGTIHVQGKLAAGQSETEDI